MFAKDSVFDSVFEICRIVSLALSNRNLKINVNMNQLNKDYPYAMCDKRRI